MPTLQHFTEDQNEIRNASDRVVVVAARYALGDYLKYSAYVCQPHRSFQPCVCMAFYTKNKIDRHIPKIVRQIKGKGENIAQRIGASKRRRLEQEAVHDFFSHIPRLTRDTRSSF